MILQWSKGIVSRPIKCQAGGQIVSDKFIGGLFYKES